MKTQAELLIQFLGDSVDSNFIEEIRANSSGGFINNQFYLDNKDDFELLMDCDEKDGEGYGEIYLFFHKVRNGVDLSHTFHLVDDEVEIYDIIAKESPTDTIEQLQSEYDSIVKEMSLLRFEKVSRKESDVDPLTKLSSLLEKVNKVNEDNWRTGKKISLK